MARAISHPHIKDITLDGILHALSDSVRRDIVIKLAGCKKLGPTKMNCSEAACPKLSPSTISFHHKVLRESGLIRSEKVGVEVINSLRKEEIDKRFPGLLESILSLHHSTKSKK